MSQTATELSSDKKRELLSRLLQQKAQSSFAVAPLSHGQRALWFVHQLDPESSAYNILYASRVRLDVDRRALAQSLQQLVERHATLRTTYATEDGLPSARIHAQQALSLEIVAAADWTEAELDEQINRSADRPFDLENGPVLRAELFERRTGGHVLLVTAAHIAIDYWSIDVMFDELQALYRQAVTGTPANLRPLTAEFRDFAAWQEEMLAGAAGQRLWDYWREHLARPLPALDLPTDRPRPPVQTYGGASHRFELPQELAARLSAIAKAEGATLYMTLLAAFQVVLFRYSGQTDIVVGSTTSGRNLSEWEAAVGYFLNVVAFRARCTPEMTFQEFLGQVRETVLGGLDHQDFPFPVLVQKLAPPRDVSRSPVFQVAFNWDKPRKPAADNSPVAIAADRGHLGLDPFAIAQQGSAFDLTLVMLHRGDLVSGALQYNTDLFDAPTIARLAAQFGVLLEAIAANPRQPLAALPLLSRSERQTLVEDWNDTAAEYPRDKCLHDLVAAQAARTPDKVAVSQGDRSLTYRQLDERSNQLACYLQQRGVGPDSLVAICLDRTPELVVGLLGILKAGGAYVPLSPGTPAERLAYMLSESQAPVVLTEQRYAANLPPHSGQTVLLDRDWPAIAREAASPLPLASQPQNLAYVIFTSGSTGRPKGVEIEHQSVVNFLASMQRRPGINADDKLLAVTTPTFDISVLELFLPLTVGAEVAIAPREITADGQQLAQLVTDSGATIMQATPATWRLLIQAGWRGNDQLKVLCGGEALPRDLANLLLERCGSLWNMYGPTETTIWSGVDRVLPGSGSVLIGPPIANTQFYILDGRLQPTPIGVPGELYIGGEGLARGYLRQPELTAERFVPDPFHASAGLPDGSLRRIYCTGDLARYRPDGRIEFLGRLDNQVKVRGFRIELGDIEAALVEHPGVRESVVTARQMSALADDKQLVAYVVPSNGQPPGTSELRDFLKLKLPDYMLPATFLSLPALPLNPSGKVDRRALPEPQALRPDLRSEYAAPRTHAEAVLAEIWTSILGHDRVGIHDDYFELGGASMQSLEISARAAAEGMEFTPALLFQHPTIAQLAAAASIREEERARLAAPAGSELDGEPIAAELVETRRHGAEPVPPGDPHTGFPDSAFPEAGFSRSSPSLATAAAAEIARGNTIIESLGVHLPPNEVTTDEVIRGCARTVWFPLERMAGIHARRMSGPGDYCVDLARKAVEECLAYSKYGPDDIDLVMVCNIARGLEPILVAIDPNIALYLKRIFGFKNAVAFDVTNACGGMFTGMTIADKWLQTGTIRRALVVSGEYITGITRVAQLEIDGFLDSRIACLTVGDAGAAVLLESGPTRDAGFHELELYSVSRYNKLCIGSLTDQPHGGPIMHVPDPIKHTSISAEQAVIHAKYIFEKSPWPPEQIDQLIIHQTSRRSLRDGMRAINKAFGKKISRDDNTLDNLSHRANTGSTTHSVALWDHILGGKIQAGDRTVFAVSGSGQVIGTGLYTFDDLPDRLRKYKHEGVCQPKANADPHLPPRVVGPRIGIRSLGTSLLSEGGARDTTALTTMAAERCLSDWGGDRNDIDLVLFAGMTRTGHVSEPAIATFIAGELQINDWIESGHDRKTLAFDIYNGAVGFLNACEVASRMIQSGDYQRALITASEFEVNTHFTEIKLGLVEAGSAVLMEVAAGGRTGFGSFVWHYATEHLEARTILGRYRHGRPLYDPQYRSDLEDLYLAAIQPAVRELLAQEGLTIDQIALVLPPQFSSAFNARLAAAIGIPLPKVVDLGQQGLDLFTSAVPFALEHIQRERLAQPGEIGLVVQVGSGLQVGCATYYF